MDFLAKIWQILLILTIIYFWNKYIPKLLIHNLNKFHKKNNAKNINKQPVKFFIDNELIIIKLAQYFYWFGAIIICISILLN